MAGATTPEHITANARVVDWYLSAAEMEELDCLLQALAYTWNTPQPTCGRSAHRRLHLILRARAPMQVADSFVRITLISSQPGGLGGYDNDEGHFE
jgi:hypothetical protein